MCSVQGASGGVRGKEARKARVVQDGWRRCLGKGKLGQGRRGGKGGARCVGNEWYVEIMMCRAKFYGEVMENGAK